MNRAAILALALLVAACTEDVSDPAEQEQERGGAAAGEVLGGEISDAMIPLQQLESQAPLARRAPPSAADVDAEQPDVSGDMTPSSEGAEAASAAPAPEPAPDTPAAE